MQGRTGHGLAAGVLALLVLWALVAPAGAAVILIGPRDDLARAIATAADGDEILIEAGDYRGQVAVITQRRLTLRGVGGRPVLHAAGQAAEGKGILVVRNGEVLIENIEFRGARVRDRNGAGIRFERGRLVVRNCAFFDNENGILTANFGDAELLVQDSDFGQAPAGTPLPHLVYVGRIARFTIEGSRVRAGQAGHLVKSRAMQSFVRYNELVDGPGGRAAYELEFPNGGLAVVVGNVIGQSRDTTNPVLVSYAAEGPDDRPRTHGLYMAHNTLVNDGFKPALFLRVADPVKGQPLPLKLYNNLFAGLGVAHAGWGQAIQGNFPLARAALRDADAFDFRLAADSVLRGRAVAIPDQGAPVGQQLQPRAQFKPPTGRQPLPAAAVTSPGALQIE